MGGCVCVCVLCGVVMCSAREDRSDCLHQHPLCVYASACTNSACVCLVCVQSMRRTMSQLQLTIKALNQTIEGLEVRWPSAATHTVQ